jgi:hypothetical protein
MTVLHLTREQGRRIVQHAKSLTRQLKGNYNIQSGLASCTPTNDTHNIFVLKCQNDKVLSSIVPPNLQSIVTRESEVRGVRT